MRANFQICEQEIEQFVTETDWPWFEHSDHEWSRANVYVHSLQKVCCSTKECSDARTVQNIHVLNEGGTSSKEQTATIGPKTAVPVYLSHTY